MHLLSVPVFCGAAGRLVAQLSGITRTGAAEAEIQVPGTGEYAICLRLQVAGPHAFKRKTSAKAARVRGERADAEIRILSIHYMREATSFGAPLVQEADVRVSAQGGLEDRWTIRLRLQVPRQGKIARKRYMSENTGPAKAAGLPPPTKTVEASSHPRPGARTNGAAHYFLICNLRPTEL